MKAKWLPNLAIESGQGPTLLRRRALGIDLLPVGTHLHLVEGNFVLSQMKPFACGRRPRH
jgi:hypothetical protein